MQRFATLPARQAIAASLCLVSALAGLALCPAPALALDATPPAVSGAAPPPASRNAPTAKATAQALAQFGRAVAGQADAIAPALATWQALLAADPTNPALRAYVGSLTALQATTTWLPWRKMGYADDGLALLDKALAQLTPAHDLQTLDNVPVSLQTRLVAVGTFLALPSMFNRAERGARLLDGLVNSPLLAAAPTGFQAAVWMQAAKQASRLQHRDEARQWLGRVVASGSPQSAEAETLLKGL